MRSGHVRPFRPLICAHPVSPGRTAESLALTVVASFELEWQHWSGANDAHLTSGHVDQLGEFVEREPA